MNDAKPVRDIEHFEHGRGNAEQLALLDAAGAVGALAERFAVEQLHHQERRAIFARIDVEDIDGCGVTELVHCERLLLEPGSKLLGDGDFRMEDFDRAAPANPVCRLVNCSHPADADKRINAPFAPEDRSDSCCTVR
ncbi:hypothetical protein BE04_29610 [Sorangium cellulosum]|uniref:Uncharacterized protein n=2 Tax=Sorangium cellulosum TaxID=56 RepID=A0A150PEB5_SORCE|nr:hypothetical protein SCE1572_09900 [Sorangium cellulosum So0157-2]KYF54015.1 hypothetical protein BE04_29610 [Sorangium cellulosum]